MKTILSILLTVIGIIALMASPIDEMSEDFAVKLYGSKAVMVIAFGAAILLNTSKREEKEFLDNQTK